MTTTGIKQITSRELLLSGAEELGTPLTAEQADSMFLYLAELKKWNRKINLTAITGDRDMVIKHLLDSLSYIKGFSPKPGLTLLDMGSGAGFPAIPLKIAYPSIKVTLIESVKKKASFLRHAVRILLLKETEVLDTRTDQLGDSYQSSYDIITARAFANIGTAVLTGLPFLKSRGLIVLSRGPEETISDQELLKAGADLEKKIELTLPHSNYKRAIWIFKKSAQRDKFG